MRFIGLLAIALCAYSILAATDAASIIESLIAGIIWTLFVWLDARKRARKEGDEHAGRS